MAFSNIVLCLLGQELLLLNKLKLLLAMKCIFLEVLFNFRTFVVEPIG